jgi:hypothetical protein
VRPVKPDPDAPHVVGELAAYWDERRHRQGKPDLSTCAADLAVALEHTLRVLRAHRHALLDANGADAYAVGQVRGLLIAHDLITGILPLDFVPVVLAARPAPPPAAPPDEPDTYPFKRG